VIIRPGQELEFLHPLAVEALWGVGPATADRLRRLGVTTVGELAALPVEVLESTVGRANGRHLGRLARGVDDRSVRPDRDVKSVSHEETYPRDRYDRDDLRREIVRMADAVGSRLRRAGLAGRTVTLKVRYGDFVTRTRSRTESEGICDGPSIAGTALLLLDGVDVEPGVRLLGVGVSHLMSSAGPGEQMRLDLDRRADGSARPSARAWQQATGAVDAVRGRFGDAAVGPAVLLGPGGLGVKRPGDTQWGPTGDVETPLE
jgi:DNA polymerase-4